MSTYRDDSLIEQFNRAPAGTCQAMPKGVLDLVRAGDRLHQESQGYFDLTLKPLLDLWGFGPKGQGEAVPDAERLADSLVNRDRDDDDRRLCLECRHLHGAGPYRCGNARAAGVHADLARDLVLILQRCHGYDDARLPMGVMVDAAPPTAAPAPEQPRTPSGPSWRELDRAYLAHHQQCSVCQCAGRGYGQRCATGFELWAAYSNMNSDLKG